MGIAWEAVGTSDTGRVRPGNEDAFLVDAPRGIFLVADGMGGHAAGEIASRLATEAAGETLSRAVDGAGSGEALTAALQEAFYL
ncbi:MAG: protein phosphatase 2C domain-containing protein, partial [Gemmatimonadota bacterium]|nr:protein phosphatase 2C domain-containing protein [Gemmatimonadota bacterium]